MPVDPRPTRFAKHHPLDKLFDRRENIIETTLKERLKPGGSLLLPRLSQQQLDDYKVHLETHSAELKEMIDDAKANRLTQAKVLTPLLKASISFAALTADQIRAPAKNSPQPRVPSSYSVVTRATTASSPFNWASWLTLACGIFQSGKALWNYHHLPKMATELERELKHVSARLAKLNNLEDVIKQAVEAEPMHLRQPTPWLTYRSLRDWNTASASPRLGFNPHD